MKTFQQFNEDVDRLTQRRQQLRQRQLKQMAAHKEKVAAHQESHKERVAAQREAEKEKTAEYKEKQEQERAAKQEKRQQRRAAQQDREALHAEKESIKSEIKRELQTEQIPYGIKQSPYTQGIAKRTQSRMISAPSKHRANVIKRLAKSSHYGDHHKYD